MGMRFCGTWIPPVRGTCSFRGAALARRAGCELTTASVGAVRAAAPPHEDDAGCGPRWCPLRPLTPDATPGGASGALTYGPEALRRVEERSPCSPARQPRTPANQAPSRTPACRGRISMRASRSRYQPSAPSRRQRPAPIVIAGHRRASHRTAPRRSRTITRAAVAAIRITNLHCRSRSGQRAHNHGPRPLLPPYSAAVGRHTVRHPSGGVH